MHRLQDAGDSWDSAERAYYRDLLRAARYSALQDAEGFEQICFALEEFGQRLSGKNENLNGYKASLKRLAMRSALFELPSANPETPRLNTFNGLFETVRHARNDAMHTGVRARRATDAAVELCLGLEDALMTSVTTRVASDYMVKNPTQVMSWNLVTRARQLMLMHSFSFLPLKLDGEWLLVSEMSMAKYLNVSSTARNNRLTKTLQQAITDSDEKLIPVHVLPEDLLRLDTPIEPLLAGSMVTNSPMLWLVIDGDQLSGVLSPFDLI